MTFRIVQNQSGLCKIYQRTWFLLLPAWSVIGTGFPIIRTLIPPAHLKWKDSVFPNVTAAEDWIFARAREGDAPKRLTIHYKIWSRLPHIWPRTEAEAAAVAPAVPSK